MMTRNYSWKPKHNRRDGPEAVIQEKIIKKLTILGWYVVILHGNLYQIGMPDLFACHSKYGIRLIEVKNPLAFSFTAAQQDRFPKLIANGCQVWVLTSDSDEEINKLFKPCNYWHFIMLGNRV